MKFWFGGRAMPEGHGSALSAAQQSVALVEGEGPTIAEQARTLLAAASSVRLGVAGGGVEVLRHVVAVDGSVVLLAGEDSPVVRQLSTGHRAHVPVQLRAVDVSSIAVPERVRGTVVMAGRLGLLREQLPDEVVAHLRGEAGVWADLPLLRLHPRRVMAIMAGPHGPSEPVEVDLEIYREARTDPLVGVEQEWLQHADEHHRDVLSALLGRTDRQIRPVALDRWGIVLRTEIAVAGAVRVQHQRVWFDEPVACACELPLAVDDLVRNSGATPESWNC